MSRLFGAVRQLGLVVRDFDAEIAHWINRGVGPFFVRHGVTFEEYHYRGQPSPPPSISVGRSFSGGLNIEVITQTNDAPSAFTEFLATGGTGAQHIAYWYGSGESYDKARASGLAEGLAVVMEGSLSLGDKRGRFIYFEGSDGNPMMVELSEALLPPFHLNQAMAEQAAADFDGSNPIR